jgi:hypothetical protein
VEREQEVLVERLSGVAAALHRVFYAIAIASLLTIYLAIDEPENALSTSPTGPASQRAKLLLDDIKPIAAVADYLRAHPDIVNEYRAFIGRYEALTMAAQNLLMAATDQERAGLSAADINQFLSPDNLAGIAIGLDMYAPADDVDEMAVDYDYFVTTFISSPVVNHNNVVSGLRAAELIVNALGSKTDAPIQWPDSFTFPAFVARRNDTHLLELIARASDPNVGRARGELASYAAANNIQPASSSQIREFLTRGERFAKEPASRQKVQIAFLPTSVERIFFIACAPVCILFLCHVCANLNRRRRYLRERVLAMCKDTDSIESAWPIGSLRWKSERSLVESVTRLVLYLSVASTLIVPLVSQGMAASFLYQSLEISSERWLLVGIVGTTLVLSSIAVLDIFRLAVRDLIKEELLPWISNGRSISARAARHLLAHRQAPSDGAGKRRISRRRRS